MFYGEISTITSTDEQVQMIPLPKYFRGDDLVHLVHQQSGAAQIRKLKKIKNVGVVAIYLTAFMETSKLISARASCLKKT